MKKKIIMTSILAVLMLVAISFSSAVGRDTDVEKKESPLYRVRIKSAVGEKISGLLLNLRAKFFGQRLALQLPFRLFGNFEYSLLTTHQWTDCSTVGCKGC
jgi:hypothetical protein